MEELLHVTLLSNFARGYDKYRRAYDKAGVPESSFPDRFFLLRRGELEIGLKKAAALLAKTRRPGDRPLVLLTRAETAQLSPNERTGLGRSVARPWIAVEGLEEADGSPLDVEEAYAASLRILTPELLPYEDLRPRSVSILPVPLRCDAACPFCFSKASASLAVRDAELPAGRLERVLREAKARGAQRAVITGGGEPSLLGRDGLLRLISACAKVFSKVVLITNGSFLAREAASAAELVSAGLRVLALSRHHHDHSRNASLMRLDADAEPAAREAKGLRLRWICVLQKGAVQTPADVDAYAAWAAGTGADEACFKELYVSTSRESIYHDRAANAWSRRHQVPLSVVTGRGWRREAELPWGAPIFAGPGLRVAAYTEPSLFWERRNGLARSWNLMADGRCLASLEDAASEVLA